jgi:hypothetical protein
MLYILSACNAPGDGEQGSKIKQRWRRRRLQKQEDLGVESKLIAGRRIEAAAVKA